MTDAILRPKHVKGARAGPLSTPLKEGLVAEECQKLSLHDLLRLDENFRFCYVIDLKRSELRELAQASDQYAAERWPSGLRRTPGTRV